MKMMKSSLGPLNLLLFITTSGLTSVVFKQYKYFYRCYTWTEAQAFCRDNNLDLATIYTQEDVNSMDFKEYQAWASLHKYSDAWHWFWRGGPTYSGGNWAADEPDSEDDCGTVSSRNKKFYGKNCGDYFFFFCETFVLPAYILKLEAKTWNESWVYCKQNYDRLAYFSSSDLSTSVNDQDFPVWIGLHRDGGSWTWSTGSSNYRSWEAGEPSNNDCVSISSSSKEMATQDCGARFPFICMGDNVILVKENKSWEEALDHCRGLTSAINSSPRSDLLSLEPGGEYNYVMSKVMEANTEEVWTGLRFLAGDWLWVNGAGVMFADLPVCPSPGQHCGALSKKKTGSMEARDCLDRKNFLCYTSVS